jgi:putative phosphoesterase
MKLAALYDIHANFPALEAVLADVRTAAVDRIVIGGDVVPGPMPLETLAALRALDVPTEFIRGNGDRVVLAERSGGDVSEVPEAFRDVIRWSAAQLDEPAARWMASWPLTLRISVPPVGTILFCHATPRNDVDIFTRRTPEEKVTALFGTTDAELVVCGHTHMQFDRTIGGMRVVNAGSVGMPFQPPGAYWLLIDDDVHLKHTPYDRMRAADRIRRSQYPQAESFAANHVLRTPDEGVMLDTFDRAGSQA